MQVRPSSAADLLLAAEARKRKFALNAAEQHAQLERQRSEAAAKARALEQEKGGAADTQRAAQPTCAAASSGHAEGEVIPLHACSCKLW